jgi:hypothetical protein
MTAQVFFWWVFPILGTIACFAWIWYDKHFGYGKHSNDAKSGKNTAAE